MNVSPGNWYYLDGAVISDKINEYGNFFIAECRRDGPPQDAYNLRLMAASKDMLEALKSVFKASVVNGDDIFPPALMNKMDDAITKATK